MELTPTLPLKTELSCRKKFVALPSSGTGLLDDAQHDALPVGCTAEAPSENKLLLDCVCDARKVSEFSIFSVANKCLAEFTFLLAAIIPGCHHGYVSLSQWKTSKPYDASAGFALHSTLPEIPFKIGRPALCQKILPV